LGLPRVSDANSCALRERCALFHHWVYMMVSRQEQAARLRTTAAGFRASAAQTDWPAYRDRMLAIAADLEREAGRLDLRVAS